MVGHKLSGKPLHRVYVQCVEQNSNPHDSFAWMKSAGYLKRHDGMARSFYYHLRHACGFDTEVHPWYNPDQVQGVMEKDHYKFFEQANLQREETGNQ